MRARIADCLAVARKGEDETVPLFRLVANNRGGGRLNRALVPAPVYRDVVCHYADGSGPAEELEGVCAHSLRATAASTPLREGARPEAVRDWLGLASLAATALYYRYPASDRMSPTLRIFYSGLGDESAELPAFPAEGLPGKTPGGTVWTGPRCSDDDGVRSPETRTGAVPMTADLQSRSGPIARIRARRGYFLCLAVGSQALAAAAIELTGYGVIALASFAYAMSSGDWPTHDDTL